MIETLLRKFGYVALKKVAEDVTYNTKKEAIHNLLNITKDINNSDHGMYPQAIGTASEPVHITGLCDACHARDAHIATVKEILWDERHQNKLLTGTANRLVNREEDTTSPINNRIPVSMAEQRQVARMQERTSLGETNPAEAYWRGRGAHYEAKKSEIEQKIAEKVKEMAQKRKPTVEEELDAVAGEPLSPLHHQMAGEEMSPTKNAEPQQGLSSDTIILDE